MSAPRPISAAPPARVIQAYAQGYFPMADARDGPTRWYRPRLRAVLPLDAFRPRRSLRKRIRRGDYLVTRDLCFGQVIRACAAPRSYEQETWINDEIIGWFDALHAAGIAHSVEAWRTIEPGTPVDASDEPPQPVDEAGDQDAQEDTQPAAPAGRAGDRCLVGGLYGLALGGAFFGESMFSHATDASNVCLAHLVEHLRAQGFTLLDVQAPNPHLSQFGVECIPLDAYLARLEDALRQPAVW